jgi:hypothetical protein
MLRTRLWFPSCRWLFVSGRSLALLLFAVACGGCQTSREYDYASLMVPWTDSQNGEGSVTLSDFKVSPNVENGSAYESVTWTLPDNVRRLYVPPACKVFRHDDQRVTLLLKKSLGWAGHVGGEARASIRTERQTMGCCMKIEDAALRLGLFGDWSSFEGGSSVEMVLLIPSRVPVSNRKSLHFINPYDGGYNAGRPPADWFVIPTHPDARRLFERYSVEER